MKKACPESHCSSAVSSTTHWTVVLAATQGTEPEAGKAWQRLASDYWYPLYAYVRRLGHSREEAEDLTQAFFARLISRRTLERVEPRAGRLLSFLLVCMTNFIKDETKRDKRGCRSPQGGLLSLNRMEDEQRYLAEPADGVTPAVVFERRCARAVLDLALSRLEAHYSRAGKSELFEHLVAHVVGDPESVPHAEIAEKLHMSHGAVRTEMIRLRRRFADLFRKTVADTVEQDEVEEEMRHIIAVLRG